jgi:Tol biopolymer transport system component
MGIGEDEPMKSAFLALVATPVLVAASLGGSPPPGGRIVLVCFVPDPLANQICSLRPDGSGYRRLTSGPERINSESPGLSPNGRTIVFERGPAGSGMDTFTTDLRRIAAPPRGGHSIDWGRER